MLAIYRLPHRIFLEFFLYKNLHIEPFNYAVKSICFDFCSTNVGSSVIRITYLTKKAKKTLLKCICTIA